MKIFICGSFGLLLLCLPAYATDDRPSLLEEFRTLSQQANRANPVNHPNRANKRLASISNEEEPTTASKTPKRTAREERASVREYKKEVLIKITKKVDILNRELPELTETLDKIYRDLQKIATNYINSNPPRACELAALGSDLKSLSKSVNAVMRNLNTKGLENQQTLLRKGLAISASGALTQQIDNIISALQGAQDTHQVDCRVLKNVALEIKKVTNDIDVTNFNSPDATQ